MRFSLLAATLVLAACAPHVVTTPAPTPVSGSRIRYSDRRDTTDLVLARLVSLDADSMVFERFVPGDYGANWVRGSLPTGMVARLQVKVGRRGNAGRGALIGGVVGAGLGIACANEESGWLQPSPAECFASGILSGAATGLLIGALLRSDVWAPAAMPWRDEQPAVEPMVSAARGRTLIGITIPIGSRLGRLGGRPSPARPTPEGRPR